MIKGLYSVNFTGPQGSDWGVAVIDGGRIHGGDTSYFYVGGYRANDGRLEAQLRIGSHGKAKPSVLGPLSSFDLHVQGTYKETSFLVSGSVPGQPKLSIQIQGRKISDLDVAL